MEGVSLGFDYFEQSRDRLIPFYVRWVAQAEEKLQPSSRYKLSENPNPKISLEANIQLLREARHGLDDEWENLLYFYEVIKKRGDHRLLIQYVDSLTPYLGYRGEWLILSQWLEDGVKAAEACNDRESIGVYLLDLGWLAAERGAWEDGLHYYNRVLNILKDARFPLMEALVYLRLGWHYDAKHERKKSQQCFEKSQQLYKELDDPIGVANATLGLGTLLCDIEAWEDGEKHLKAALDLYTQVGDSTGIASVYHNLARLALHRGQTSLAKEYYLNDLTIMEQTRIKQDLAQAELALGQLEVSAGDIETGMKYLLAAQAAFSELGSYQDLADTYWGIAAVYMKKDETDTAIEYLQLAAQIYRELDVVISFAQVNRQLGIAFSAKGDNESAEKYYGIAHENFSKLLDPRGVEKEIIGNASHIFVSESDYYALLAFYETLQAKMIATESARGIAHVQMALGDTYCIRNQYLDKALVSYSSALSYFESLQDLPGMADARDKLGDVYRDLEKWDDAVQNYSEAVSLFSSLDDNTGLGWSNSWLGTCYAHKKEWDKALEAHQRSLQARSILEDISGIGWSHLHIGDVFKAQQDWDNGIVHFREAYSFALKCNDMSVIGWACAGLGDIYLEKGDLEQAINFYLQPIQIETQSPTRSQQKTSLILVGRAYKRYKQFENARKAFRDALQISDELGDDHDVAERYLDLAELHQESDLPDEALAFYQMAEHIFDRIQAYPELPWVLFEIAKIFKGKEEYGEEILCYQKILSKIEYLSLSDGSIANLYALLGDAYSNSGHPEQGIEPYQRCFEKLSKIDAPAATAGAYLGLGFIYAKLGQVEQEINSHVKALMYAEKAGLPEELGMFQGWLADSYYRAKQYDNALKYYFQSLSAYEQQENSESQIKSCGKIAITYRKLGDDEKMNEYVEKAALLINGLDGQEQKEELITYVRYLFAADSP